jgi:hypothetical protein
MGGKVSERRRRAVGIANAERITSARTESPVGEHLRAGPWPLWSHGLEVSDGPAKGAAPEMSLTTTTRQYPQTAARCRVGRLTRKFLVPSVFALC